MLLCLSSHVLLRTSFHGLVGRGIQGVLRWMRRCQSTPSNHNSLQILQHHVFYTLPRHPHFHQNGTVLVPDCSDYLPCSVFNIFVRLSRRLYPTLYESRPKPTSFPGPIPEVAIQTTFHQLPNHPKVTNKRGDGLRWYSDRLGRFRGHSL